MTYTNNTKNGIHKYIYIYIYIYKHIIIPRYILTRKTLGQGIGTGYIQQAQFFYSTGVHLFLFSFAVPPVKPSPYTNTSSEKSKKALQKLQFWHHRQGKTEKLQMAQIQLMADFLLWARGHWSWEPQFKASSERSRSCVLPWPCSLTMTPGQYGFQLLLCRLTY